MQPTTTSTHRTVSTAARFPGPQPTPAAGKPIDVPTLRVRAAIEAALQCGTRGGLGRPLRMATGKESLERCITRALQLEGRLQHARDAGWTLHEQLQVARAAFDEHLSLGRARAASPQASSDAYQWCLDAYDAFGPQLADAPLMACVAEAGRNAFFLRATGLELLERSGQLGSRKPPAGPVCVLNLLRAEQMHRRMRGFLPAGTPDARSPEAGLMGEGHGCRYGVDALVTALTQREEDELHRCRSPWPLPPYEMDGVVDTAQADLEHASAFLEAVREQSMSAIAICNGIAGVEDAQSFARPYLLDAMTVALSGARALHPDPAARERLTLIYRHGRAQPEALLARDWLDCAAAATTEEARTALAQDWAGVIAHWGPAGRQPLMDGLNPLLQARPGLAGWVRQLKDFEDVGRYLLHRQARQAAGVPFQQKLLESVDAELFHQPAVVVRVTQGYLEQPDPCLDAGSLPIAGGRPFLEQEASSDAADIAMQCMRRAGDAPPALERLSGLIVGVVRELQAGTPSRPPWLACGILLEAIRTQGGVHAVALEKVLRHRVARALGDHPLAAMRASGRSCFSHMPEPLLPDPADIKRMDAQAWWVTLDRLRGGPDDALQREQLDDLGDRLRVSATPGGAWQKAVIAAIEAIKHVRKRPGAVAESLAALHKLAFSKSPWD